MKLMKKIAVLFLLVTLEALAGDVTFYILPPEGVDWSSPSSLVKSIAISKLTLKDRPFGDVYLGVNCTQNEVLKQRMTDFDFFNQILFQEKGMGILFHSFEGELSKVDLNKDQIPHNFIRFLINDYQCARVENYLSEFKEKNVGRYFGFSLRPRFGEGATGTSLAISFLEVLDILDQEMKDSWVRTLYIPETLLGPPFKDSSVTILDVLDSSWAKHTERNIQLSFWDPILILEWVKKKTKSGNGIEIDKKHIPVPKGPIWLQHLNQNLKKTN